MGITTEFVQLRIPKSLSVKKDAYSRIIINKYDAYYYKYLSIVIDASLLIAE